jgi:hypothetical protein
VVRELAQSCPKAVCGNIASFSIPACRIVCTLAALTIFFITASFITSQMSFKSTGEWREEALAAGAGIK